MNARRRELRPARFIALLRAINVGGRTVRMEQLRDAFGMMGFTGVATFIASGNVIFDTTEARAAELEQRIEHALATTLGYEVPTFLRSPAELEEIVSLEVLSPRDLAVPGSALYVGFLKAAPGAAATAKVAGLVTDDDDLRVHGRELYWLARRKMSESKLSNAALERALGMPMTMRNITTVRKLAAKYPATP